LCPPRFNGRKLAKTLGNNGILSQLEIAVGAAMLGVIGIVFSLSIFFQYSKLQKEARALLCESTRAIGFSALCTGRLPSSRL